MISSESRSLFRDIFHAPARCRRYRAEASTGEMRSTSGGACHGNKALVRSTLLWLNQLFADATSRVGTFVPWLLANSPAAYEIFSSHETARAPSGNSPSLATYIKDGSSNRSSTTPGAVSCGMRTTSPEPSDKL